MNGMTTKTFIRTKSPPSRRPGGFTLIELLLVLAILASLAAVVVPKFTRRSQQAKVTAGQTELSNIQGALESFEVDCGRYPTSEEGINALVEQPLNADGWNGEYLGRGASKDPWGNPYVYQCPGRHNTNSYDIHSFGPDGQDGGGDDIDNWSER